MNKMKEVIRLKAACGLSQRAVARSCRLSPSTVGEYLDRYTESGLDWDTVQEFKQAYDPWSDLSGTVQENVDLYTGKLALTFQLPGIPFSEKASFAPILRYSSNIWSYRTPSLQTRIMGGYLSWKNGEKDPTPFKPKEDDPPKQQVHAKIPDFWDNDSWLRFSPIGKPHNMPGWSLSIGGVYTEYVEVSAQIDDIVNSPDCNNLLPSVSEKKYFVSPDGSIHPMVDMATNCRPFYGHADGPCQWENGEIIEWECNRYLCKDNNQITYYCLPDSHPENGWNIWRSIDGSHYYYIKDKNTVYGPDGTRYELYGEPHEYAGMIQRIIDIDGNSIEITIRDEFDEGKICRVFCYTGSTGAWLEILFEKKELINWMPDPGGPGQLPDNINILLLHKIRYPNANGTTYFYRFENEDLISHLISAGRIQNPYYGNGPEAIITQIPNYASDGQLTYGEIFYNDGNGLNCPAPINHQNPGILNTVFCSDQIPTTYSEANYQLFVLSSA